MAVAEADAVCASALPSGGEEGEVRCWALPRVKLSDGLVRRSLLMRDGTPRPRLPFAAGGALEAEAKEEEAVLRLSLKRR